ncbi:30S ribosomal protein S2 [Gammaproteobacteria bacterium]|nr:30S ribosomal protein S2 [Gammaproteobacteria bacterium]
MVDIVDIKDMFDCAVHLGHKNANPKMSEYIFTEKNDLKIIDLIQTQALFQEALVYIQKVVSTGGKVVFVGTKPAAKEIVAKYAAQMQMPFVDQRWLGGMLTNFKTVKSRVGRLEYLNKIFESGDLRGMTKKERLVLQRERAKLALNLGGVQEMHALPEALFVVDVAQERIAIREANKLGIPVIGIVDTSCSPEGIDYIVPGNDDALSAIEYYMSCASSVVESSRKVFEVEQSKLAKKALPKISKQVSTKEESKVEKPVTADKASEAKIEVKEEAPKKKRVVKKKAEEKVPAKSDDVKKPAAKRPAAKKPATKE